MDVKHTKVDKPTPIRLEVDVKDTSYSENDEVVEDELPNTLRDLTPRDRALIAFEDLHECHKMDESSEQLWNTLHDIGPRTRALIRPYMVIDAICTANDGEKLIFPGKLLLDTGSLDGSYVGRGIVDKHPQMVRNTREYTGVVYMADSKSHVKITRKVLLDMEVKSLDGTTHRFSAWFCVLGEAEQFILGYPHLTQLP